MIKLILLLLVGYLAIKTLKGILGRGPQAPMETGRRRSGDADGLMVQDLNCRTYLSRRDAVRAEHKGETYYFCSRACRDAYLAKL